MCADAAAAAGESALELERWTSWLFGELWRRRGRVLDDDGSWELALGTPIIEDMAAVGGEDARIALSAIARFDRGELGAYAFELECRLRDEDPDYELPEQVAGVGRPTITQAAVVAGDEDGEVLFVESRWRDEDPHTVTVFVDGRLGWIAKRIGLVVGLDAVREQGRRERGGSPYRATEYDLSNPDPLDPVLACGRLRDALLATDLLIWPPVADDYAALRALALSRACALV